MTYHHSMTCIFLCLCLPKFHTVPYIWHIIDDHPSFCLWLQLSHIISFSLKWSMIIVFVPMSSRNKYRVINVRHLIYTHRRLCLCPPEIDTVSVMFDISSMLVDIYVCVFHSSVPFLILRHFIYCHYFYVRVFQSIIPCPSCLTYHLWPSLFMFVFSRVSYRVLVVWHIIYDLRFLCLCLPEFDSVSLLFYISFIIIVVLCLCLAVINSSTYHLS